MIPADGDFEREREFVAVQGFATLMGGVCAARRYDLLNRVVIDILDVEKGRES